MKALGDYLHGKGLKFGIYQVPVDKTCAQYASRGDHHPGQFLLRALLGRAAEQHHERHPAGHLGLRHRR